METILIVWPFVLFFIFVAYGLYTNIKDRRVSNYLKFKVSQLGGKITKNSATTFFPKNSLVFGFVDDTNENITSYSFVKNGWSVSVSYIDKFIGWSVTSTVILIKSPVFEGMNIVVLNEDLPGYSQINRKLQMRGADFVKLMDLNRPELLRYLSFLRYLFGIKSASKVDFYDGYMAIVVGNFLKSNMLSYEQIDHILDFFIKEQSKI